MASPNPYKKQRQDWTQDETKSLLKAVEKFENQCYLGSGNPKWKTILELSGVSLIHFVYKFLLRFAFYFCHKIIKF